MNKAIYDFSFSIGYGSSCANRSNLFMETSWDCRIDCLFWLDSRQIHFFIPWISAFENPYLNRPKKLRYLCSSPLSNHNRSSQFRSIIFDVRRWNSCSQTSVRRRYSQSRLSRPHSSAVRIPQHAEPGHCCMQFSGFQWHVAMPSYVCKFLRFVAL